jgi:hypothetical protein
MQGAVDVAEKVQANTGSSGSPTPKVRGQANGNRQRLRRSRAGAFLLEMRDNREEVSPVPPLPQVT